MKAGVQDARAPMISRTDIPSGDWRLETKYLLKDTLTADFFNVGLFVAFNDNADTDVSGKEYLFGFNAADLQVELTGEGPLGKLTYHNFTDADSWVNMLLMEGGVTATLAITRRGSDLIFSAQLPNHPWQLVGSPVTDDRVPKRIGLFSKLWGSETFANAEFDYVTLSEIDPFTAVGAWELY